jgi:hypothetical protein
LVFSAYEDRRPELDDDDERLAEIHLYFGSFCNRSCDFCVVFGSPEGWVAEVDAPLLDNLLELIHPEAQFKIYGGEPTLLSDNLLWACRYLRQGGFAGRFVIFSNGVQADRLIRLLDADEHSCCALNYSILTGTDAEPLPAAALRTLSAYECDHPGRIFAGHAALVEVGRAVDWEREQSSGRDDFAGACPRCHPVVTTRGQHHACPFAVENSAAHYQLGNLETPPEEVLSNFRAFLEWIDAVLEPAAGRQRRHPCAVCVAPEDLPMPAYAIPFATAAQS